MRKLVRTVTLDITVISNAWGDYMAEHRVKQNNIIYIIPTDELFKKWKNDEAFIDEYSQLMNRKPHRVLKKLRHYVDDSPMKESSESPIKGFVGL